MILPPVCSALQTLWLLGAIDKNHSLTPLGHQMAIFPVEPHLSRSILASASSLSSSVATQGCTKEVLTIISILSSSSKLFLDNSSQRETISSARLKFKHHTGDHMTILNIARAYDEISTHHHRGTASKSEKREWCKKHFINERTLIEAKKIKEQLIDVCKKLKVDPEVSCGENEELVLNSLGFGLVGNSALLQQDGSYKQAMGHSVSTRNISLLNCSKTTYSDCQNTPRIDNDE